MSNISRFFLTYRNRTEHRVYISYLNIKNWSKLWVKFQISTIKFRFNFYVVFKYFYFTSTKRPSLQGNAIPDMETSRRVDAYTPRTHPRRQRASEQHEHRRGNCPGRGWGAIVCCGPNTRGWWPYSRTCCLCCNHTCHICWLSCAMWLTATDQKEPFHTSGGVPVKVTVVPRAAGNPVRWRAYSRRRGTYVRTYVRVHIIVGRGDVASKGSGSSMVSYGVFCLFFSYRSCACVLFPYMSSCFRPDQHFVGGVWRVFSQTGSDCCTQLWHRLGCLLWTIWTLNFSKNDMFYFPQFLLMFSWSMTPGTYDAVLTADVEAHIKYRAWEGSTRYLVWIINEYKYSKKKSVVAVAHPRPMKYHGRFLGKNPLIPVVTSSRGKILRGGRFPQEDLPW